MEEFSLASILGNYRVSLREIWHAPKIESRAHISDKTLYNFWFGNINVLLYASEILNSQQSRRTDYDAFLCDNWSF